MSAVTYISHVSCGDLEFCNRSQLLRELAQLNAVARRRRARSERLITTADAVELIGGGEAPLRALVMPSGFRAVAEPPSAEQLDPFHSASEELVNKVLLVRIE